MGQRFAAVGPPLKTAPETMASAVAALKACRVSDVAHDEALVVREVAWQRAGQARRAAALQVGAEAFPPRPSG